MRRRKNSSRSAKSLPKRKCNSSNSSTSAFVGRGAPTNQRTACAGAPSCSTCSERDSRVSQVSSRRASTLNGCLNRRSITLQLVPRSRLCVGLFRFAIMGSNRKGDALDLCSLSHPCRCNCLKILIPSRAYMYASHSHGVCMGTDLDGHSRRTGFTTSITASPRSLLSRFRRTTRPKTSLRQLKAMSELALAGYCPPLRARHGKQPWRNGLCTHATPCAITSPTLIASNGLNICMLFFLSLTNCTRRRTDHWCRLATLPRLALISSLCVDSVATRCL